MSLSQPRSPWPTGFDRRPWRFLSRRQTGRAVAWSLCLGVAFVPVFIAALVLLAWIPLVARLADAACRRAASWLGVAVIPRGAGHWFDWQQTFHLVIQLLLGAVSFALWMCAVPTAGLLLATPFIFANSVDGALSLGEWSTDNSWVAVGVCWPVAIAIVLLLVYLAWLLAGTSVAVTKLMLSGDAEELQASRATIIDAFSGERRRIERALHDGPQQHLIALKLNLAAAQLAVKRGGDPQAALESAQHNATAALSGLRDTVRDIAPQVLFDRGLVAALDELTAHCGIDAELNVRGRDEELPETVSLLAYHGVAEALTNAVRHGHADAVRVDVELDDRVSVRVRDNGGGLVTPSGSGTGIKGLRERAAALGGTVELCSQVPRGTEFAMEIPRKAQS